MKVITTKQRSLFFKRALCGGALYLHYLLLYYSMPILANEARLNKKSE